MLKTASSFANSVGALNYKGAWNASTNTPTLVSGVGTKGDYYVVSVAGTTNLDGTTLWGVGDLAVFNGSIWQKIDGGDTGLFTTITVAGLTGYMYANNNTPVTASTTIPVANVNGAVPNTVNVLASGLLTGGGALTGNVTVGLTSVPVANVPGAVPNTVNVLTTGLLSGGGALTGNVTVSLTSVPFANVTGAGTMASQNANAVAITGGTVDNVVIGGTTPNAATFTTLTANSTSQFGRASANYKQVVGGATGNAVVTSVLGSDTNISQAIQSKGTGAIDLAAGSNGVNISNGGTVTAITRTATGSGYTSPPIWSASAPTTAGGTTASGTTTLGNTLGSTTVVTGGTGYTVGDVLTFVGGTFSSASTVTVSTVSSGVITAVTVSNAGAYSVLPSNPISVTGGTGTSATFSTTWGIIAALTISVAGSGYVEQPTVTFSGGGGSGAAAYATVGAATTIKTLFGTATSGLDLATPAGAQVSIVDIGDGTRPLRLNGGAAGGAQVAGISTSTGILAFSAGGGNTISFYTNGRLTTQQFAVSHTASAVNYVQVTGAATGARPTISSQGSDGALGLNVQWKGGANAYFISGNGTQFRVLGGPSNTVNNLYTQGSAAGSAPVLASEGTDTDIQLSLVPKGLGIVLMNQQTPTAVTATGTLTIANLLTQIITSTSAVAVALTLPTGTLSDAGVSGGTSAVNTSFNWSIINTGSAVGDVTLVAGTAHTIVGSVTVAVGTTGSFRSRKTATNTFVTYRV